MASLPLRLKLRAYVDLPHPWAVLIVMLATALFGLLATDGTPNRARYALMLLTMFGGQLAIGALNEFRDRELDALSKPYRPIPAGLISPRAALAMAGTGLALMLVAGMLLGVGPLLVASVGIGCGIVYDLWFKGTSWSWLPYLVALPLLPIWVWLALERAEPRLLLLYPLGAPMVLAVHLAQSLPDAESDRAAGVNSLAARLGPRRSLFLLVAASLIAALDVAVFAALYTAWPWPALVAALCVAVGMGLSLAARRAGSAVIDRHLFKIMTGLTVVLGLGWVLAAGL